MVDLNNNIGTFLKILHLTAKKVWQEFKNLVFHFEKNFICARLFVNIVSQIHTSKREEDFDAT